MEDVFNLSGTAASSFLDDNKKKDDGLLRPKLEDGKDGRRELVIRLLPNLQRDGKIGPTAIEKHIHYANFKNKPELSGYFDCLKNTSIGKSCPLCDTYWALMNTKNPVNEDKAKKISRSTKYYSYVYVVEDKQVPENEGKIFIWPFGYKIFQKIETKAKSSRKPVKVEDLIHGANLNLVIQEVGGYYNYDASEFEAPEPIEINGKMLKVGEDGKISKQDREAIYNFLYSREHDLEEYMPKDWTPEQTNKVNEIISYLTGVETESVQASRPVTTPVASASQIFDNDDDDDDDVVESEPVVEKTTRRARRTETDEVVAKETPKEPESDISSAKKRAAAFFEDDED